jgi:hypothetical protein
MPKMTETIVELGKRMTNRSGELTDLHPELGSYDIKAAMKVMGKAADDLDDFVTRTKLEMPLFSDALSTAMHSFGRATSLSLEFGRTEPAVLVAIYKSSVQLRTTISDSKDGLMRLRGILATHPRVTSVYNKAKRRALAAMDELAQAFDLGAERIKELETTLAEVIRRLGGDDLDVNA